MSRRWSWSGSPGGGILRLPPGPPAAGVVALSGAQPGSARQPLFEHLASVLGPLGIALLTYDRRPTPDGTDTPLAVQAADARAAVAALRRHLGVAVGLFGFSQGAWAATVAAADGDVSNLVVVGHSAVSPAEQMRFHVDQVLRAHGFDRPVRARARDLRERYEQALRGSATPAAVDAELAAAAGQDWFPWTYLPAGLPSGPAAEPTIWVDMDHDPLPAIAAVRAPVLAIWGEHEGVVPLAAGRRAWAASPARVETVILPGCGHWPLPARSDTNEPGWDTDDHVSDGYVAALADWYRRVVGRALNRRR